MFLRACKQTVPESLVVMIILLHNLWQYKQTTEYIRSRAQLWLAKELICVCCACQSV